MASYPPPSGPPFSYTPDPRQQARYAREQLRAQKAAWQAQKRAALLQANYARQQARIALRGQRRSSILGPVLVLSAGIVLLLIKLGRLPYDAFTGWYGRWWPALLVLAGLVLVAEWGLDQAMARDGATPVRRSLGGGVVFLLILLGSAGFTAQMIRYHQPLHGFSINPDNLDSFFGEKHELAPEDLEQRIDAGTSVSIDNAHGDVSITGKSDDNKVHIIVSKQVYGSDSDVADRGKQLTPQMQLANNQLHISVPSLDGGSADLAVTVPENVAVTVSDNRGDIAVSNLKSALNVTSNHGDVDLRSIAGNVNVHVNHNDSTLIAHDIGGDLILRGRAQDITIVNVAGQTTFDGDFYGDTHLEHLHGPMRFQTSRTHFSLARLDGHVDIDHSDLSGDEIVGPTELRVHSRNISFNRVSGDLDVTNSNGEVTVTGAPPLGNVNIQNSNGEVNLTVPEHAGATIDAETRGGDTTNDLSLSTSKVNDLTTMQGKVGDGAARIRIETSHADIALHRGLVIPMVTEPPPAAPPAPAAKPARPPHSPKPMPASPSAPVTF